MTGLRIGVVTFPGSLDDVDARRAVGLAGHQAVALWHGDHDLQGVDAVVLPGGFSYGDYLRCGAISRFSPLMTEVVEGAERGLPVLGICNGFQVLCEAHLLPGALVRDVVAAAGTGLPVLGICNGFQVLCEAGLLPGALTRNSHLHFRNRDQVLVVENPDTAFTRACAQDEVLSVPVKHTTGRYYAPPGTLPDEQVVLRYAPGQNPNGSMDDVAGVCNEAGNVMGLMPHPEHAVDPLTGSQDGLAIFESLARVPAGA